MSNRNLRAIVLAGGQGKRMQSDLPKVLHQLRGKAMVEHVIDRVRDAGIDKVVVVVGYRRHLVMEHLAASRVQFAVQEEQLGTGHAVQRALPLVAGARGSVIICYGDMPLLTPGTIRALVDAKLQPGVDAAILTTVLDNPPDFGRVLRDDQGRVKEIIEVRDASSDQLKINEVNVGVYCFDLVALESAIPWLTNDNAQREFYLTDLVRILVDAGRRVETVQTDNPNETLGINDRAQLELAERLGDFAGAGESPRAQDYLEDEVALGPDPQPTWS